MSTLRRVWLRRGHDETGFTIIEVVVALVIFGLVITGIAASSSSGLRLVTKSNGRQTATQLAVQEMELLRSTPYDSLGLAAALTKSPDPDHPDSAVSTSGTAYTVPSTGTTEPLTILSGGSTAHGPIAASRNGFQFSMYRYVTWLDDPANPLAIEDYKRVTIVVMWAADAGSTKPNIFAMSSLFSPGSVGWVTPASTTSTSSTTLPVPTTSTTLSTAPPPNCVHTDTAAPFGTIAILAGTGAGTGYTSQNSVALQLSATDDCSATANLTMLLSNDGVTFSEFAFSPSYTWALGPGNGNHTVFVKYKDQIGNLSGIGSATIRVDSTKPTTPPSFAAIRPNGANKETTLTWAAATDNDTLVGYRIYKQVGTAAFTLRATVSAPCSPSPCQVVDNDTPSSNNPKYTFYVVSYDAAGNESNATASITVN